MRWTIRGIQSGVADAVRELAFESGCSLGEVVMLCIQHGLPEARRDLNAASANEQAHAALYQHAQPTTPDMIFDTLRRYMNRDGRPT